MHGETALHCAADNERHNVVRMLLSGKANPDVQRTVGGSALLDAATRGDDRVVGMLLECAANPNVVCVYQ